MSTSIKLYSLTLTIDIALLLGVICLHIYRLIILVHILKLHKNQQIIMAHSSLAQILVRLFRFATAFYFLEYKKPKEQPGYQILRSFIIQGWCVCYVLVMIVISIDPLMIIKLKLKYNSQLTKRRLKISLVGCWVVSITNALLSFTVNYDTREKIAARYTFPIISFVFLCFATLAYVTIYRMVKQPINQSTNQSKVKKRSIKFQVPVLTILNFLLFGVVPTIVQVIYRKKMLDIHWLTLGIFYSIGFIGDAENLSLFDV